MKNFYLLLLLICNVISTNAYEVDTLIVVSNAMNKSIKNIVITPTNYNKKNDNYSVLYLLHGADGNYKDWISNNPIIKEYSDTFNIIIVCPDGGFNSWYFDSPIDQKMKYETYISDELINAVDSNYRTIKNKTNRVVTGLSMGGHGALYLAFRHQDIWGAAGSMSGGLDIRSFKNDWNIPDRLGDYENYKNNWENNTIINMVSMLKGSDLKIIFDCGVDDFFYDVNKKVHDALVEMNIPHDYTERSGGHSWEYWSNSIKYQLLFFNEFFKSNN